MIASPKPPGGPTPSQSHLPSTYSTEQRKLQFHWLKGQKKKIPDPFSLQQTKIQKCDTKGNGGKNTHIEVICVWIINHLDKIDYVGMAYNFHN